MRADRQGAHRPAGPGRLMGIPIGEGGKVGSVWALGHGHHLPLKVMNRDLVRHSPTFSETSEGDIRDDDRKEPVMSRVQSQ